MVDLFGRADALATAGRAPADAPPSDFSESLRSASETRRAVGQSLSANESLYNEYERYLAEVAEVTGKRLPNPFGVSAEQRGRIEALVSDDLRKLSGQHPDMELRSPEDIRAAVGEQRQEIRARRAAVARREISFGAKAGAFIGDAGTAMVDPPVLASMFFGAPAATGILRAALVEAAAAGAGEVVAQVGVQLGRKQFGEQPDLGEAALSVAAVAGGAGVLTPVVRGGVAGVRALMQRAKSLPTKSSLTRAAERVLRRQVELEDASPLEPTPAGRAEHVERLSEAQIAVREGRPVRLPERPRAAIREDVAAPEPVPTEVFGDDDLGRVVAAVEAGRRGRVVSTGTGPHQLPVEAGGSPPPPDRPPRPRSLAEERGDIDLDSPAGRAEDDALEARVRAMAEAEPDARVVIEEGESVRALTARQLIEELDEDRTFVAAVKGCLAAA